MLFERWRFKIQEMSNFENMLKIPSQCVAALDQIVQVGHILFGYKVQDRLRQKWAKLKLPAMIASNDEKSISKLCHNPTASMRKSSLKCDQVDWFDWRRSSMRVQSDDPLLLPVIALKTIQLQMSCALNSSMMR